MQIGVLQISNRYNSSVTYIGQFIRQKKVEFCNPTLNEKANDDDYIFMAALFFCSHESKFNNSGLSFLVALISLAPQKSASKSALN